MKVEDIERVDLANSNNYGGIVVSMQQVGRVPEAEKPLRAAGFLVSIDLFAGMFKTGTKYEVLEGLPDDAKIVGMRYDPFRRVVGFAIESDSFDMANPSCNLPEFHVTVRRSS